MSLDNVLAVAGAARDHLEMLIFGLVLSIALMALTANYIAKLLEKHTWLGYLGLAIIGYVAIQMIWQGTGEVMDVLDLTTWFVNSRRVYGIPPVHIRSALPSGFSACFAVFPKP